MVVGGFFHTSVSGPAERVKLLDMLKIWKMGVDVDVGSGEMSEDELVCVVCVCSNGLKDARSSLKMLGN